MISEDEATGFGDLLRDPLIRLVMESDGVSEDEMRRVLDEARRACEARQRIGGVEVSPPPPRRRAVARARAQRGR